RHSHEALGGQVHHEVRIGDLEERADRGEIAQVGLEESHLRAEVIDVLSLAAPPVRAEDLSALGQGVLGHVAPHEAGDARDEDSHACRAPGEDSRFRAVPTIIRYASERPCLQNGLRSLGRDLPSRRPCGRPRNAAPPHAVPPPPFPPGAGDWRASRAWPAPAPDDRRASRGGPSRSAPPRPRGHALAWRRWATRRPWPRGWPGATPPCARPTHRDPDRRGGERPPR